ncbi:MAG: Reverse transcriptase (RNA-dependent DNA polymerase) [Parcubacteria group bacterium ADurb.Bin326]|nr:MAG: Reverse transcriptase (RNA-dependent DNA polymerase) [Parcubacteria group bacterium ADurb.Bin326]
MNEFDQFVKRNLKAKYYIRYADDFLILHNNKKYLEDLLPKISEFLDIKLKLKLHPKKVSISTLASGVDYLGWVHFHHHRVLRTATKKRIMKKLNKRFSPETKASYLGLLSHGDTYNLKRRLFD